MAKKILLADDSITIQKVVELTFSDGDYEVVATNNGNKAIQRLAEWKPDIILSDIIMPEKNGYELCEYVKSHPDFRNIPVILLTGTFEPFDPDRAEKAGCDAVITKPFESQSLIHKVEELIGNAAGSSGLSKTQPVPAVSDTKAADESGALSGMEDSQTKAWPLPKLDMGWSAAKPDVAAPPPAEPKPAPRESAPKPGTSAFNEPPKEDSRPAAAAKSSSPFDDGDDFGAAGGMSSTPAFEDEPMNSPSEPEAGFDFSGATKAFPKMNFEELQSASGSRSASTTPEPPAESGWSAAPEKAPARDWDSPGFGGSASPSMKTEESPFGDELPEPESSQSESIFSSSSPSSGFGSSPSPAGFGSSPAASGLGSSSSPSSIGSSPSPAGFASPASPSGFGSSVSPTRAPEVAVASTSKPESRAAEPAASAGKSDLSEEQIDKIARRVVELMSEQVVRNIAWEVIPDLAEMVVRERIRQLESEN